MENITLIRKIYMKCPMCDKTHEVEERKRLSTIAIKGENVSYEERYYFCVNAEADEKEFEIGAMTNENLFNARNAYRKKHGLLTSDEIVAIRECYGLSQVDLARLLGWGEATISRYESKAIQDNVYDAMLRIVKDNPLQTLSLLKKNGNKFSNEKKREIRLKIIDRLDSCGKEFLSRQAFAGEYVDFEEPCDANGYATLDIDKIEASISYMAEQVPNLYKVKLMKMLWYSDVKSYIKNGRAITGMVYRHDVYGALPIGHYSLMNLATLNVREEAGYGYDLRLHIYPCENINYSVLSKADIAILDKVIKKFKNYKTKEIVDYMHEERAYKETMSGEIIPYSIANSIRKF